MGSCIAILFDAATGNGSKKKELTMLEKIDLTKKIAKPEYKTIITGLELKLAELQREAKDLKIPVIVVFEGWDAAGKGTMINRLILSIDPRGFTVYPTNPPNEEERLRPFLWRFWSNTPEKGRITIFDRSWYGRVLVERVDKIVKKKDWMVAYDEIKSFERQLVDEGAVIIKFFLHIDKNEQKKRFKKLQNNSSTAWKVTKDDWKHHKQYREYFDAVEDMLAKTDTEYAPWTIVEAHDRHFASVKIFKTIIDAVERKKFELQHAEENHAAFVKSSIDVKNISSSVLDKVDLSVSLTREEYSAALKKYQQRIRELEHEVYIRRLPIIMVYEGWDAAGKGGNIKR
ncbi:MAG TPA: phosphate--AMP phosphotransferase, partial [Bacteroidetes bacterium]|nr:phosphate--AMP phosphotransferase [Bacteroidota bacterium]